jgi:hypothetical protein
MVAVDRGVAVLFVSVMRIVVVEPFWTGRDLVGVLARARRNAFSGSDGNISRV